MTEAAESVLKGVALKVVTGSPALGSVLRGVALKFVTGTAGPESIVRGVVLMVMTQDAAPEIIRRGAVLQVTNALTAVAAPESNVSIVASSGLGNSLVMLLMG